MNENDFEKRQAIAHLADIARQLTEYQRELWARVEDGLLSLDAYEDITGSAKKPMNEVEFERKINELMEGE